MEMEMDLCNGIVHLRRCYFCDDAKEEARSIMNTFGCEISNYTRSVIDTKKEKKSSAIRNVFG